MNALCIPLSVQYSTVNENIVRLLVNEQYDDAWNTWSKNKSKIILQKSECAKYAGAEITRANTVVAAAYYLTMMSTAKNYTRQW